MKNNNKISNVKESLDQEYIEYNFEESDLFDASNWKKPTFAKYQKPIINTINQTAGGTKSKVVGQMSDIVPIFIKYCLANNITINQNNWREWYNQKYPNNFDKSLAKIKEMAKNYKDAINSINEENLVEWLENFLFHENLKGLLVQNKIMELIKLKFPEKEIRPASPDEEKKNIDIVIDGETFQVKPLSIKQGTSFNQGWADEKAIWYEEATKDKKPIFKYYLPKSLK